MSLNNNLVPLNKKVADDCIPATTIFSDEATYCLQDSFKLTKEILKCQLDIFNQIDSVLASIQERSGRRQKRMGMRVRSFDFLGWRDGKWGGPEAHPKCNRY